MPRRMMVLSAPVGQVWLPCGWQKATRCRTRRPSPWWLWRCRRPPQYRR